MNQNLDSLSRKYSHLSFQKRWEITKEITYLIGQSEAFVNAISNTPILPEYYNQLLQVSLRKGALATTAIEGNTLTEAEIEKIQSGLHLPPSKEYQEIEVMNVINTLNILLKEVVYGNKSELLTVDLLKRFHRMIGENLGEHLDGIPGQFRKDARVVGYYRCPEHDDVPDLIDILCDWLIREFHFVKGQSFEDNVIQAILAHVYIEWIHPFADGNGRTGRLVEFYILLRGGIPEVASHIMSNHYNSTRSEYYRQLANASRTNSLTEFIRYALIGFRDGLRQTLEIIQQSQKQLMWQKYIYDKTDDLKGTNSIVFKRKRTLMLEFPINKSYSLEDLLVATTKIALIYGGLSRRTLLRDLEDLIKLNLIVKEDNLYKANIDLLKGFLVQKVQKK